jgi:hypothetical protein
MPWVRRIVLVVLLFTGTRASALTFTVDDLADTPDAATADGFCATADAVCTLRAALEEAMALGGQHDITLPEGLITVQMPLPTVTADVTVTGQGADLSIVSGGGTYPIFRMGTGGALHVDNLRLSDAVLVTSGAYGAAIGYIAGAVGPVVTITSAQIRDNEGPAVALASGALTIMNSALLDNLAAADQKGGAVFVSGATLTVANVLFIGNEAKTGFGAAGGAIAIAGAPASAVHHVTNGIFTNNTAIDGGAIYYAAAAGAQSTIEGSTFTSNSAIGANGGGALWLTGAGTITVSNSTFLGNFATAGDGGGTLATGALALFSGSTFAGNQAAGGGGGLCGFGLRAVNSTFDGNQAAHGGGIWFNSGTNTIANVTIAGNTATGPSGGGGVLGSAHPSVRNSIVAGNTATTGPDCGGGMTSAGYNLLGDGTGCSVTAVTGDQVGTGAAPIDPLLAALAGNGGPTQTRALQTGSPAIDAGNPTGCTDLSNAPLVVDQRGALRPTDGDGNGGMRCDAGAFEAAGIPTTTTTTGPPGSSTTSTTTTVTTLTTSTTLAAVEVCDDCVDDDGDGLVDFADPDCCAQAAATSLTGRLTPAASATKVRLALAFIDPGIVAADPVTQAVVVELHGEGFDYCARVPAGRFVARKKGKLFTFKDRSGAVAAGLDTIVLKRTARGFKATIAGRRAAFATPLAGELAVVLAFDGDGPDHCATIARPFATKGRKGALVTR